MNPKDRFLSVFSEDRQELDRVPTFVQGVLGGFIQRNEEHLFDNYEGELTYNASFDAPIILGYDSVFASLPGCVGCKPMDIVDENGIKHVVGLNGQAERHGSNFYAGGLVTNLDMHEELWEGINVTDNRKSLLKAQEFHESVSHLIFPLAKVGGIFDTAWQSMGFDVFARHQVKNTSFYRQVIKDYAWVTKTNVERIIEVLDDRPAIIAILDDVAFKGRLMISPERWQQDIAPHYKEITSMIRDAGMHAIMHSDGDMTDLVPALMDAGFEGLQGWEGGADPRMIVEQYPEFVTIGWGDVGNELSFGSKEEIDLHVKFIMDAAKENRHLVIGPSTVIFEKIPFDNAKHFMTSIKSRGMYGKNKP
ncbi:hypothetical protein GF325_00735 [Candidatus Bathyarchaeota archaeon]|nr:hypothetical protein [Candidatus Bathyarchaeota archaeon]